MPAMPVIEVPCQTPTTAHPGSPGRLTSSPGANIIVVADVSFWPCSPAAVPKESVGPDHGGEVDVYSIYKETRSSEEPGARERHYAGWVADQDDAKRRASEIYGGRDSTEAVVVIGNGPAGVEVVYRLDGEN